MYFIPSLFAIPFASGAVKNEALSDIIYYAFLALVISVGVLISSFYKKTQHGTGDSTNACRISPLSLSIKRSDAPAVIALILPTVTTVFLISLLTSLVLKKLGISNETALPEGFALSLITHALIPALFEEAAFRYVPLTMLSYLPISNIRAALISASAFALFHMNPYQIPYAFAAGIIFALLDFYFKSILPSVIIHFANNAISLIMLYGYAALPFYITASVLLLISLTALVLIYKKRTSKNTH